MPGRSTEAKGTLKKGAGKLLGNEQMEAEGQADQVRGKAARETAGAANQAAGAVQSAVGGAVGDEEMRAKGQARRAKGKTQSAG